MPGQQPCRTRVGAGTVKLAASLSEHEEWCRPLSYLDPEEHDGPAWQSGSSARPNDGLSDSPGDGREDTDLTFARIVAGLRAEQDGSSWPARDSIPEAGEEHFDPPEPPPLPIPRPRTVGGVLTLTVGVLLLVAPSLLDVGERVGTPLGLLAVTAGIGWLVIGLRPDPPADESDDGARL